MRRYVPKDQTSGGKVCVTSHASKCQRPEEWGRDLRMDKRCSSGHTDVCLRALENLMICSKSGSHEWRYQGLTWCQGLNTSKSSQSAERMWAIYRSVSPWSVCADIESNFPTIPLKRTTTKSFPVRGDEVWSLWRGHFNTNIFIGVFQW